MVYSPADSSASFSHTGLLNAAKEVSSILADADQEDPGKGIYEPDYVSPFALSGYNCLMDGIPLMVPPKWKNMLQKGQIYQAEFYISFIGHVCLDPPEIQ